MLLRVRCCRLPFALHIRWATHEMSWRGCLGALSSIVQALTRYNFRPPRGRKRSQTRIVFFIDSASMHVSRLFPAGQDSLQIAVENLIADSLPNGRVHASAVAETLGLSPRTLVL